MTAPVVHAVGAAIEAVDVAAYQVAAWDEQGFGSMKIKVGRDKLADPGRVKLVRSVAGPSVELMADVTRCGGITSLLRIEGLCKTRNLPSSAYCAPAASAHACCAMAGLGLEFKRDEAEPQRVSSGGGS
jgi:L-alanine-DL-glutamate epimerase-like enolase superfamily enzyme